MLKRNQKMGTHNSAQSMVEYLVMIGAVLAVVVVFTRPGGMFTTSVNQATELTIATMNVTATDVFNDIGTKSGGGPFVPPACPNGSCGGGETCATCPADCGVCPPSCPDGACNGGETCGSCPADCGVCPPACPDGLCNGAETCATCPADCGVCPPACPDGSCNGGETCATCPADCGVCPPACPDGSCNGAETCATCPADCGVCPPVCPDGACNGVENCGTCPADCGVCPPVCPDGACNGAEICLTCPADCGICSGCGCAACPQGSYNVFDPYWGVNNTFCSNTSAGGQISFDGGATWTPVVGDLQCFSGLLGINVCWTQ